MSLFNSTPLLFSCPACTELITSNAPGILWCSHCNTPVLAAADGTATVVEKSDELEGTPEAPEVFSASPHGPRAAQIDLSVFDLCVEAGLDTSEEPVLDTETWPECFLLDLSRRFGVEVDALTDEDLQHWMQSEMED